MEARKRKGLHYAAMYLLAFYLVPKAALIVAFSFLLMCPELVTGIGNLGCLADCIPKTGLRRVCKRVNSHYVYGLDSHLAIESIVSENSHYSFSVCAQQLGIRWDRYSFAKTPCCGGRNPGWRRRQLYQYLEQASMDPHLA